MSRAEQRALEAYPDTYIRYRKVGDPEGIQSGVSPFPNTHILERKCYIEGYEQAEKDLGWISVKDRLPEVGHFVLTCVSDTETPQCVGMAILLNDGTWWDGDMKVCVDYWMEVPKLKEEKK